MDCNICMDIKTNGIMKCCKKNVCLKCIILTKQDCCSFCRHGPVEYTYDIETINITELKTEVYSDSECELEMVSEDESLPDVIQLPYEWRFKCIKCKEICHVTNASDYSSIMQEFHISGDLICCPDCFNDHIGQIKMIYDERFWYANDIMREVLRLPLRITM